MSWTKPNDKLFVDIPNISLFSGPFLLSIILAIIVQMGFQVLVFLTADMLEDKNSFVECYPSITNTGNRGHSERVPCTRDTALYLMSIFEYLIVCVCFSIFSSDGQFRQPIYRNQPFFISLLIIIVYNIHKLLFLDEWNRNFYELADISNRYRVILILFVLLNLLISISVEYLASNIFSKLWFSQSREDEEIDEQARASDVTRA